MPQLPTPHNLFCFIFPPLLLPFSTKSTTSPLFFFQRSHLSPSFLNNSSMEDLEPTNADTPTNDKAREENQFTFFFFSGFLYKVFLFAVLIYVVPLFPSQPPEFINQTFLTKGWELIHLLLVGIAVSYGLFSQRNAEKEVLQFKVEDSFDPHMSRVTQGASVLDDGEGESLAGYAVIDGNKTQMWNSRCYGGETTVVVTPDQNYGEREELRNPLSLPVKSLNSNVFDSGDLFNGIPLGTLGHRSVENGGELGKRESMGGEEKSVVILPSPIPWRLRSEIMELNGESRVVVKSPPSSSSSSPSSPTVVLKGRPFQSRRTRRASLLPVGDRIKERSIQNSPPPSSQLLFTHRSKFDSDSNNGRESFEQKLKDTSEVGPIEPTWPTKEERTRDRRQPLPSAPPGLRNQPEKESGFYRKFIIDSTTTSDEDSDSDGASIDGGGGEEEESNSTVEEQEEEEGNVDKKADEFIAKFREQIRLQRIESKKSTVPNR